MPAPSLGSVSSSRSLVSAAYRLCLSLSLRCFSRSSRGIAQEISAPRFSSFSSSSSLNQDFTWHCLGVLDIRLHLRGPRTLLWSGVELRTDDRPAAILCASHFCRLQPFLNLGLLLGIVIGVLVVFKGKFWLVHSCAGLSSLLSS